MFSGKKGRLVTVTRDGLGEASTQLSRPLALALDSHNCVLAHLFVVRYAPGIRLSLCYASRAPFGSFSYRIWKLYYMSKMCSLVIDNVRLEVNTRFTVRRVAINR